MIVIVLGIVVDVRNLGLN